MKKILILLYLFLVSLSYAAEQRIRISTGETDLIYQVSAKGRLYQVYLGNKLKFEKDIDNLAVSSHYGEAYSCAGTEDLFEPAFAIQHNDGNLSSVLKYVSHQVRKLDNNVTETVIKMKDEVYPVEVELHYISYAQENIIKTWSEIKHNEKKAVTISRYASSMLYFSNPRYYLTEFSGNWAKEVQMSTQELTFGKKVLETKLGSRAAMFTSPFFELGLSETPCENSGEVLLGTLGWTGNFNFTFEIDTYNNLRVISGINPYQSNYELKPNEVFTTPEFIFTLSSSGTGKASRNFHSWALNYALKDGRGDRMTLLNNWENTYFNFDQTKLSELMKEGKDLGVDLFLLDDGWFGNKYPRNNDYAGLGDWEVNKSKLPDGIPFLIKQAQDAGVKFGIWIEPEMVNPQSELAEKHPDWIIKLPNRETYYYRHQLVLDLSNPKVQDFVFDIVDKLMTENPQIAFFKWDCNSMFTNVYSPYLKDKQQQLYIDYVRGLYNVFNKVKSKYPNLPMMLCSGGGGRCDYEALKYFTEFWCSDNTDPVERIFIQWGFLQFFPAKALCAHVTGWNPKTSIKFRMDVAMMCKLGFDISLKGMTSDEQVFCKQAVQTFNRLEKLILEGNHYRLVSPYETNHTAILKVDDTQTKALLYAYDIYPRFDEVLYPVKLQGLNPDKQYKLEEINLMPNTQSHLNCNNKIYSGDYLMKAGISVFTSGRTTSHVIEISEVR